jgi:hypothetical protein
MDATWRSQFPHAGPVSAPHRTRPHPAPRARTVHIMEGRGPGHTIWVCSAPDRPNSAPSSPLHHPHLIVVPRTGTRTWAQERKKLLSFVVVGGGPTGVEVAAELYDMIECDLSKLYPNIVKDVSSGAGPGSERRRGTRGAGGREDQRPASGESLPCMLTPRRSFARRPIGEGRQNL